MRAGWRREMPHGTGSPVAKPVSSRPLVLFKDERGVEDGEGLLGGATFPIVTVRDVYGEGDALWGVTARPATSASGHVERAVVESVGPIEVEVCAAWWHGAPVSAGRGADHRGVRCCPEQVFERRRSRTVGAPVRVGFLARTAGPSLWKMPSHDYGH